MERIADLIHDWNQTDGTFKPTRPIQFDDETLRDGLQSPSALDPSLDDKLTLVRIMDGLGIDTANVGLPGASAKAREPLMTRRPWPSSHASVSLMRSTLSRCPRVCDDGLMRFR